MEVMDMIMKTRARAVGPFPLFGLFILCYCLVDDWKKPEISNMLLWKKQLLPSPSLYI